MDRLAWWATVHGVAKSRTLLSDLAHKNAKTAGLTGTLLYLKWITHKDLLCSTENADGCYLVHLMGGEVGGEMDTCICMAEALSCPPETITTLLIRHAPIQN